MRDAGRRVGFPDAQRHTITNLKKQALNYFANLASAQAVLLWLSFNTTTEVFQRNCKQNGASPQHQDGRNGRQWPGGIGGLSVNVRGRGVKSPIGHPGISVSRHTPHLTCTDELPAVSAAPSEYIQ